MRVLLSTLTLLAIWAPSFAGPAPTYAVLQKFAVGGEGGWDYLTVDSASHRLYVSRGTHVMVIDTDNGKVVGDVPNTAGVHGIALVPKVHRGYTSNGRDNTVTVFDTTTLKEIGRVSVGNRPDAIIFDPASNRVFTFNGGGGDATAIDVATGKVAGTVKLDGRPEFPQPDGSGHIFVNIEDKSEVQEIDSRALATGRKWSVAPAEGPSGLAISPRRHMVFSVCDGVMVVSDTKAGKVVGTAKIGQGPDAAGYDPGYGLAFSSNGEGTLSVVKRQPDGSFSVIQTVQTQATARTMALDPRTHRIYLAAAQVQDAPAGSQKGRRQMVPGSFTIIVVGPKG